VKGDLTYPHQDAASISKTSTGQHPFATVLSCSDSRVPVEQVFDLGIGDLFVVRVAGNVAGINELASIEYGVDHLGTPTLVVLGHTQCGAVTATATHAEADGSVVPIIERIKPAVEAAAKANPNKTGKDLVPSATIENVWMTIESIFARSLAVRRYLSPGRRPGRVVGKSSQTNRSFGRRSGEYNDRSR
jgi:carbonic anhydrase